MAKFLYFFLLIFNILQASNIDKIIAPLPSKEKATEHFNQIFYLDKFGDLLNIIDDEKKRESFINSLSKTISTDIFSLDAIKGISFYLIKLMIVVLSYYLIKRLGMRLLDYQMEILTSRRRQKVLKKQSNHENILILETLTSLFRSVFIWGARIIFTLLFLVVMGISVGPFIYSMGFLVFGFSIASQSIIKDFINGILIIIDGSIAIGEVVLVASHKGTIESITLRRLSLRNNLGELIIIPFSSITEVVNFSRSGSSIKCEVIITHNQSIEDVKAAYMDAFSDIKSTYGKDIKEEMVFSGVINVSEFGSHVEASFKSIPDPYKKITYAFRTLVHEKMRERKIQRIEHHS